MRVLPWLICLRILGSTAEVDVDPGEIVVGGTMGLLAGIGGGADAVEVVVLVVLLDLTDSASLPPVSAKETCCLPLIVE